ncbi:hypothetical protein QBC40DRAFT_286681 [Triangularia verruculosa]|uniref:Uncharacterized protein n=1 Tax=Triangularia verruculosa TaxID=2587418 RepID=A0AAN6XDZ8_9PEZI|nr:hypothetical protein QBC40DRAFT_286681 [Triangularia verruculosa]
MSTTVLTCVSCIWLFLLITYLTQTSLVSLDRHLLDLADIVNYPAALVVNVASAGGISGGSFRYDFVGY